MIYQTQDGETIDLSDDDRRTLGTLTTRDHAGRHFTERADVSDEWLGRMEGAGLITIDRPTHAPTGIPYSREHWTLEVAPEVADWFDACGNLIDPA